MPKVSVIIATHSRPHTLPHAVVSVQGAGTDVEVIVVDDASTDATATVCRKLEGIRYVRVERNQRVAGARNLGLLASTAEYISFLDDDDLRLPGTLDVQVEALSANPEAGLIYGPVLLGDEECHPKADPPWPAHCPQGDVFWELLEQNFIPCQAAVFRKDCLYRVGLLDPILPGIDDWDMWVRIAELYPFIALTQPMAIWRLPTPSSGQGSSMPAQWLPRAASVHKERWLKLPRAATASLQQRRTARRRMLQAAADTLIWRATHELPKGNIAFASRNLTATLRLHPLTFARPGILRQLLLALLQYRKNSKS